jgi:hypothetical protein
VINTVRTRERNVKECRDLAIAAEQLIASKRSLAPGELRKYLWCETCAAIMNYVFSKDEENARRLVMALGASDKEVDTYIGMCKEWFDTFIRVSTKNTAITFFAMSLLGANKDIYTKLVEEAVKKINEETPQPAEGVQPVSVESVITETDREIAKKYQEKEEVKKELEEKRRKRKEGVEEVKKDEEMERLEIQVAEEYGYPIKSKPITLDEVVEDLIKYGDIDVIRELVKIQPEIRHTIEDVCKNELVGLYNDERDCVNMLMYYVDKTIERASRARYSPSTWAKIIEELRDLFKTHKISEDGSITFELHPLVTLLLILSASPKNVNDIKRAYWYWIGKARNMVSKGVVTDSIEIARYIYRGLFVSLYPIRHTVYRYSNLQLPKDLVVTINKLADNLGVDAASIVEYAITLLQSELDRVNNDPVKLFKRIATEMNELNKHVYI